MDAPHPGGWKEPPRKLRKAMARRKSPLGDLAALPESIVLACLARLPRDSHDSAAEVSCGMRRLMRTERFLRARRAEDITEEALVLVSNEKAFVALVSDRMWRMLAQPPETHLDVLHKSNLCVIGSELFVAGGTIERTGQRSGDVLGYDAVSDDWFRIPMTGRREQMFAANVGGRLVVGGGVDELGRYHGNFEVWDANSQTWQALPDIPEFPGMYNPAAYFDCDVNMIATEVGNKLFLLSRAQPYRWNVYDFDTGSWSVVPIPDLIASVLAKGTRRDSLYFPDISVLGDRILIKEREPGVGGGVYNYDVTTETWYRLPCSLPRHLAFGKRNLAVFYRGHEARVNDGYALSNDRGGGFVLEFSLEISNAEYTRTYKPPKEGKRLLLPICYAKIGKTCIVVMT